MGFTPADPVAFQEYLDELNTEQQVRQNAVNAAAAARARQRNALAGGNVNGAAPLNPGNAAAGGNAPNDPFNNFWAMQALGQGIAGGLGGMASAGANAWGASQQALGGIAQSAIQAQLAQQLGQQALGNQAQLYANNLKLGNNQLSTMQNIATGGYQNNLDKIGALSKMFNPLLSGIGSGQAFGGLGTGLANLMGGSGAGALGAGGGMPGSGGLMGFQSSNGVSATLPQGNGLGSYNTGVSMTPSMSPGQLQGNVNALASAYDSAAPQTPNAQASPAARQTMADMAATRGAAGGRNAATNLDRYQQAAEAKLGYDQQAQNAQTAGGAQNLLAQMYGNNLNRQLGYQGVGQRGTIGRLGAASSIMGSGLGAVNNLTGGIF